MSLFVNTGRPAWDRQPAIATRLYRVVLAAAIVGSGIVVGSGTVARAAPDAAAVYDSIGVAPGNVASLGFEATSTSEFGDRVQVGPGPRELSSVTVLMSSWACETGGWTGPTPCVTTPDATFAHPLTMTLYSDNGTGTPGGVLTSMTMTATIPYRPSADSVNCTGGRWFNGTTCYNGYAAPVTFSFPIGTVLPSRFIWAIAYNTTHHGYNPVGAAPCGTNCPYDSLNVGAATLTPKPAKGTDVDSSGVFMNSSGAGFYCDGGAGGVGVLRLDDSCWASNRPMAIIKTRVLSQTDATVVVRASTPTWGFFTENTVGGQTGSYDVGPSTTPLGTGSAQIGLTASNQGMALGTLGYAGTPLANLTNLSYSSYQTGTPQAISLQLDINYHGPGDLAYAGRLVYEPYLTDTVTPNVWQSWNALNGKWWASRTGTPGSAGLCGQGSPCTWAEVMTNWPDATIRATVLFKAGSGWPTFGGAVDALSIGVNDGSGNITDTTFDFEPTTPVDPPVVVPPPVDPPVETVPPRLADFIPVSPARVFDTRPDAPPSMRVVDNVKISGDNILEVQVTDLGNLVPASGVGAVSLNVTAVDPEGAGYVTVYPCGALPLASNLNYLAGQTVPNAVIAPVSVTGTVCFYSLRPSHLVVDINGWFRAGGGYTPVGPRRVVDTRPDQHTETLRTVPTTKLPTSTEMEVQLTDLGSYVPPSGAGAVSLNVTVVDAEQPGFLSVYPCGQRPLVSSVNYEVGETVANEVIAVLSSTGSVCFFANATIDLVVDVNGWLSSVSDFTRSGPARVVDTRPGENVNALLQVTPAPIEPGRPLEVSVADLNGLVPTTGVSAVSLNVTATDVTSAGYITVYPCGERPLVSSVNYAAPRMSTANAVLVPVSAAGTVCFYSLQPVDLVVDINGWFAMP
jgi:enamine deaminase RidA (YjgF/YER057c/UK114 family)